MGIIFDIETVGFELENLSESQQEFLLRYAEKEHDQQLKEEKRQEAERYLSLYPYTAKIISIGLSVFLAILFLIYQGHRFLK